MYHCHWRRSRNCKVMLCLRFCFECSPILITFLIIWSGIGSGVIVCRLRTRPVSRWKHATDPWKFPVGPRVMHSSVLSLMVLVTTSSALASTYAQNFTQECFLKSNFIQVKISCGLRTCDIPLGWGNAFSHITTNLMRCIYLQVICLTDILGFFTCILGF